MATFDDAFQKLLGFEGGYVNDPNDTGGETYKGVARHFNPDWHGWSIVDAAKSQPNFPHSLNTNAQLNEQVKEFYKAEYWDKFWGDKLEPDIASELFEQSVNLGLPTAIQHFQRTMNVLDRFTPETLIGVDGAFGNGTFTDYEMILAKVGYKLIYNVLNMFQGKRYLELMEKNPVDKKYVGWFSRIDIVK